MSDGDTLRAAKRMEADRWARQGYRLVRYDGPRKMTAPEAADYARTGEPPEVCDREGL